MYNCRDKKSSNYIECKVIWVENENIEKEEMDKILGFLKIVYFDKNNNQVLIRVCDKYSTIVTHSSRLLQHNSAFKNTIYSIKLST